MNHNTKLKKLHDNFATELIEVAAQILEDDELAKDAVQLVFIKLIDNNTTFNSNTHEINYLRKAVRNKCYDLIRERKTHVSIERYQLATDPKAEDTEEIDKVEQNWAELHRLLLKELHNLPTKKRNIIEDKYYLNLSTREIAQKHNITEIKVYRITEKAMAQLRNKMQSGRSIWRRINFLAITITLIYKIQ